jgi:hypothetical protein
VSLLNRCSAQLGAATAAWSTIATTWWTLRSTTRCLNDEFIAQQADHPRAATGSTDAHRLRGRDDETEEATEVQFELHVKNIVGEVSVRK